MNRDLLTLYFITDSRDFDEEKFYSQVENALKHGVSLIQLREKNLTSQEFYQRALKVKALAKMYQVPLIINDRVDICLAVDADGVHIGDEELPVDVARKLIGPSKFLGVSAKSVQRAQEAEKLGADYLGIGALFPSMSKDSSVISLATAKAIVEAVQIPSVGIGGIKAKNLSQLEGIPFAGVALINEIMHTNSMELTIKKLLNEWNKLKKEDHHETSPTSANNRWS